LEKIKNKLEENTLYIVSTPIGNLADISFRAIDVLKNVDVILCEDTRVSLKLLNFYNIKNTLMSYTDHDEKKIPLIIEKFKNGEKFAIVSDAGTPLISDPGSYLVKKCKENNIKITHIPGACSFISALVISGVCDGNFLFAGFMPSKKNEIKNTLNKFKSLDVNLVFFLSPYKIDKTIDVMIELLGENAEITMVKEITKIYETTITDSLKNIKKYFSEKSNKGEFVLIFKTNQQIKQYSLPEIKEKIIQELKNKNVNLVAKELSLIYNIKKSLIYDFIIKNNLQQ
jgi:16S rRNA (cytidine1402-2'-O)-methyltransferase